MKWTTEAPKCPGICYDDPIFTEAGCKIAPAEDMSDEEYEKNMDYIFELFSRPTPHERFYHSMNLGCWGE